MRIALFIVIFALLPCVASAERVIDHPKHVWVTKLDERDFGIIGYSSETYIHYGWGYFRVGASAPFLVAAACALPVIAGISWLRILRRRHENAA